MSQQRQENREERAEPALNQEHDDDYDVFLFWPSLSIASTDSNSSPLYGPVSLSSESSEYSYSWGSGSSLRPPSPLVFAPIVNWWSPPPVENSLGLATAPSREPDAGGQVPEQRALSRYSSLFNLGFLSQMSQRLVRIIDGVRIKLRKPKSRAK